MPHDRPDDPMGHELWPAFLVFAGENDVPLDHRDDWLPWWECFLDGAAAQFRLDAVGELQPSPKKVRK